MTTVERRDKLGVFLGFVGGVGMGVSHYVLSVLAKRLNSFLVMWYISITLFIVALFLSFNAEIYNTVNREEFPMIILRSFSAVGARLTLIMAFSHVPVYEGDMVRCTETIFVTFMGCCILKQPLRWSMGMALIFSLVGILLIYRPPWLIPSSEHNVEVVSRSERLIGIMLALASAFLISLYKVLARFITKTHYIAICLYETWIHIVLFTIVVFAMGIVEMPTNLLDWCLPMSVGITCMVCIICHTTGFRYTDAAYAGFASMSFLPTSIILKCSIERTLPNMYDFIGMACIIMSVVISLFAIFLSKYLHSFVQSVNLRFNHENTSLLPETLQLNNETE